MRDKINAAAAWVRRWREERRIMRTTGDLWADGL